LASPHGGRRAASSLDVIPAKRVHGKHNTKSIPRMGADHRVAAEIARAAATGTSTETKYARG
jgi:hypothetical protein